jgi:5'-deoxynucleotidase
MSRKLNYLGWLKRFPIIRRWALMENRSVFDIDLSSHSFMVAALAHKLGVIRNEVYGGNNDPDKYINEHELTTLGLYHETGELLVSDIPTTVKYIEPSVTKALKALEHVAEKRFAESTTPELQDYFMNIVVQENLCDEKKLFIKAADIIAAYLKTIAEYHHHSNREFVVANKRLGEQIVSFRSKMPEVDYLIKNYVDGFDLTLDELTDRESLSIQEPQLESIKKVS